MKSEIAITYKSPEEIKPSETNPKLHTPEQIEQIKRSIEEFGFNDPVAIDENGVIIEGHGRLLAARELGIAQIPVIFLAGLTDQQKTAYALVHNQLTLNTGFDYDTVRRELEQIQTFDMTKYSFELFSEEYFDEGLLNNQKVKIVIKVDDENDADVIREFLTQNGYKFKEK